jgi:predicted DNA-binding WGR domain protein
MTEQYGKRDILLFLMPVGPICKLMRVRPDKNERRFYTLTVDVDLFGCALLVRRWGRLGTYVRTRLEAHQTVSAALAALATLARTKRRRGYWNRP